MKLWLWFVILTAALALPACGFPAPPQPVSATPLPPSATPRSPTATLAPSSATPLPASAIPTATRLPTRLPTKTPTATRTSPPTLTPRPSQTQTAEPAAPFLGVHVNDLTASAQVELLAEAAVTWTRFDRFRWNEIEPVNSDSALFNWGVVDEAGLVLASAAGLKVLGIVQFTAPWAEKYPGFACGPVAESAFKDFGEFLAALVKRYGQPPYNVRYWEIGNEPDIDRSLVPPDSPFGCWGEQGDPYYGGEYYGEMLKVVYPLMKQADPQAHLLVGGLVLDCDPIYPPEDPPGSGNQRDCSQARFLEGILQAGGFDFFDGVGFHAYDFYYGQAGAYGSPNWRSAWDSTGPLLVAKTRYLKALLASYGPQGKELINSEVALLCGRDGNEPYCSEAVFEQTKASYLVQSNAAALAQGLHANIWYSLTGWRASGLLAPRSLEQLPAYSALVFQAQLLDEARYLGEINAYPGVKGYRWRQAEQEIWLLWSLDGAPLEIRLGSKPQAMYDLDGSARLLPEEETPAVQVGVYPVYLRWLVKP